MKKKYKNGMYDVALISPNKNNLRHQPQASDSQAIKELLKNDKKHKVSELAEDIVKLEEMDPSSKLIIMPDPENKGHFIVLEGNRRITALKILTNPQLADGTPVSSKIKKASNDFMKSPITEIECVEMNRDEAQKWVKRKHYNGMGGAGALNWDAPANARSDALEGKHAAWLTALNFLESKGYDTNSIFDKIEDKTTTIDRVLQSKHMKDDLGVTFKKDGNIIFENGDDDDGAELLNTMFDRMIDKSFKVTVVETAPMIKDYLSDFSDYSVKKKAGGKNKPPKAGDPPPTPPKPPPPKKRIRTALADKGLKIKDVQLNDLYVELTKIPAEKFEHCAAAMLRIFFEKTTMLYLENKNIKHPAHGSGKKWKDTDVKLRTKVKAVLDNLDPKKTNTDLKYARDVANGVKDKIHSLNTLNEYIHDHKSIISSSEIRKTWDRFHPYFKVIYEEL